MVQRILVVDDEPFNLEIVAEYLEELGCELVLLPSGQEALDTLQADNNFDLIVLDRMMPGVDGMAVLRHIKADTQLHTIPVLMQTAAATPEQVKEGLEAGAYYYLTKPYEPDTLIAIVRTALTEQAHRKTLLVEAQQSASTIQLLREGCFEFRTLEEAQQLASLLSRCTPNPAGVAMGLSELLVNAVEHGNLGISYSEKSALKMEDRWTQEVEQRLQNPKYADRFAKLYVNRCNDEMVYRIEDDGEGFDWKRYLDFDPARAFDPNGRGIAMARQLAFVSLKYEGRGNIVEARVSLSQSAIGN